MIEYSDILKLGCFTKNELIQLCGSVQNADYYIKKFHEKKLLLTIKNGLYCAVDAASGTPAVDHYHIASKIASDGYVSYHSALEYYGWYEQIFNIVQVSCPHNFKNIVFQNKEYQSVYNKHAFGVDNINGVKITDSERTILDCVNKISQSGGLEEIVSAIKMVPYLDGAKVVDYLALYNNKFLYSKIGFLFENFNKSVFSDDFYKLAKSHIMKQKRQIDTSSVKWDTTIKKWNLVVPNYLLKGANEIV